MDLKIIRKNRGLTLNQVANMTGLSQSFLTRLENGERGLTVATAKKLAFAYDISINELLRNDTFDANSIESMRLQINAIDQEMAMLFEKRMNLAKHIGIYKAKNNLAITDEAREADLVKKNTAYISDKEIKKYYQKFISNTIKISKEYQIKATNE